MSYEASQILITTFYNSGITNPIIYFLAHPTARRHVKDMSMNMSMSREAGNSEGGIGHSFSQVVAATRRTSTVIRHWKHLGAAPASRETSFSAPSPTLNRGFRRARSISLVENCAGPSLVKPGAKFQKLVQANGRMKHSPRSSLEERYRRISPSNGEIVKGNGRITSPRNGETARENDRALSPCMNVGEVQVVKENGMTKSFKNDVETVQQSEEINFNEDSEVRMDDELPVIKVQNADIEADYIAQCTEEKGGGVMDEKFVGEEDIVAEGESVVEDNYKT